MDYITTQQFNLLTTEQLKALRDKITARLREISGELPEPQNLNRPYQTDFDLMVKLKPALKPGGPLHNNAEASATTLHKFSRAWSRLLSDLNYPPEDFRYKLAIKLLGKLGVHYRETPGMKGRNPRTFYTVPVTF